MNIETAGQTGSASLAWAMGASRPKLLYSKKEAKQRAAEKNEERITQEVINYIERHPGCTQAAVEDAVRAKTSAKRAIFRSIVDQGLLEREGQGIKGDPYTYTLNPVSTEHSEQEQQPPAEA